MRRCRPSAGEPTGHTYGIGPETAYDARVGLLTLEAIGADGERLAMEAGKAVDVPVGWDSEFSCATFDSDSLDDTELEGVVFSALDDLDAAWRDHLRVAE